ncbi:hypothetical protein DY000_02029747 [Brassica cretica]|uniref:Leucine-rich repeat-containing N-terminal plant-type domain-containing protein n=1 Tax=Brassica cretica TaxID=69181 RepID=A0ABQ7DZ88_BRACR|nr:hypothetical protein DY000_02029747 [Brassica cretica]
MSGLNLLFPFLSLFVIFTPNFTLVAGLSGCGPHHIQALVQFKNEFDSSGCNQTDYFNGVLCDNITGEVTKLQLPSGCFTGVLKTNSSLFGFNHLRYLNLSYNNFTSSSLSSGFGSLNKLEVLSLSSNGFIGQVPSSLSNLSRLTELYLDHNELTGGFPLVQNITSLSILNLSLNHFSGAIPSSLLTMPFLSYLNLDENHLTGPVEVRSSSTSSRLETLHLRKNPFEGKILDLISNFTTLKYLGISFQNISYPINLNFFSSLKSLLRLDLSGNSVMETSISSDSDVPRNLEKLLLSSCDISKFPKFKFKPTIRSKRCFLMFPVQGSERKGLVSVEVKKKKGQYDMKLLAVDIPMASGPDQRLYLIGDEEGYKVGGGLISELRDPVVKVMATTKEFDNLDRIEEEEVAERELQEAERKHREEIEKLEKESS